MAASTSPTSTYKTFLMHKPDGESANWGKLVDITESPALGSDPEMLETTDLSSPIQTFIAGITGNGAMTFKANYVKSDYANLKDLEHKTENYAMWFGGTDSDDGDKATPTGEEGKWSFKGQLVVAIDGGGVNQVRTMSITIAPSSPLVFE